MTLLRYHPKERCYLRFNLIRPIMLILIAYTAKTLTQTLALIAGMPELEAENIGYICMIIAGIATYIAYNRKRKR